MAGLTFMFMKPVANNIFGSDGQFWTEASTPKWIAAGGALPPNVLSKITPVEKRLLNRGNTAEYMGSVWNQKCFILSKYELGSPVSGGSGKLGVGPNRDELYLNFKSLGIQTGVDNRALIANFGLGNFWLRDRLGSISGVYTCAVATADGNIENAWYASAHTANFYPCFCL